MATPLWITLLHSGIIVGIVFLWHRRIRYTRLSRWLIPSISIKIMCGWLVGVLYTFYYPDGDTWNYFADGKVFAQLAYTDWQSYLMSWVNVEYLPEGLVYIYQPRALLVSKIVGIGCILTHNNYWLISAYFSLLSFCGIWVLVQTLGRLFPRTQIAANIAWLAYPSFLFWSSGILKETIAVGLVSWLTAQTLYFFYANIGKRMAPAALCWLLAAGLLWLIKYYYAAVLIPLLLAIVLARLLPVFQWGVLLRAAIFFCLLIVVPTLLHPNLEVGRILEVIVRNHDAFVRVSDTDAAIHFSQLQPTLGSVLFNTPLALFSAWYRPLLFETESILAQVAGLENCVLLVISGFALWKTTETRTIKEDRKLWLAAVFLFSVMLGALLALSTPNFGTLIRYKVAFSPFLLYVLLLPVLGRKL